MPDAILKIENLSKSFEGNQVFNEVNFAIEEGELSSIIGPNGAGKTTLFNLITGYHVPDTGRILFKGENIAGRQPFDIVRLGIARAFQRTNIFPRMTVLENMVSAVISARRGNLDFFTPFRNHKSVYERAYELLASVELTEMAHQQSGILAHGNQKRLDIAVALALEPKLLLLDEPTAGMSPEERWQTVNLVRGLWEQFKITMVFIEHDMDIVFGISQRVRVLCYKTILAEGTPKEISSNHQVIEAYLGEEV
ncbi:MAG: ABC transporter ATP-binding protein [Deltaproteobacteria bacterium]|nr:ABC transporter ATP-binding protein [Deltaproteobacteria bacterium]